MCKPPDQLKFPGTLSDRNILSILSKEWHTLRDMNVNIYENGTRFMEENKIIKGTNEISSELKKNEFCKNMCIETNNAGKTSNKTSLK